jgi:transcription-repair coupling factor (superfamily II helicase)
MAPGLGDLDAIELREGAELDFEQLLNRLVELSYTRVDMVGKRGEFAVRGGILDVSPTTTDYPVRVEFWGDEISEQRAFSVADQRSQPEVDMSVVQVHPCRELLLTPAVRQRAADLLAEHESEEQLAEHAGQALGRASRSRGWRRSSRRWPREMQLLTEVLPGRTHDPAGRRRRRCAPAPPTWCDRRRSSWRRRGPRRAGGADR